MENTNITGKDIEIQGSNSPDQKQSSLSPLRENRNSLFVDTKIPNHKHSSSNVRTPLDIDPALRVLILS